MECTLDMSLPPCARKSNNQRLLAGFAFGGCAQGRFRSKPGRLGRLRTRRLPSWPDTPQTTVPLEQYARLPSFMDAHHTVTSRFLQVSQHEVWRSSVRVQTVASDAALAVCCGDLHGECNGMERVC